MICMLKATKQGRKRSKAFMNRYVMLMGVKTQYCQYVTCS